jgi:hypothetical protein
MSDTLVRARQAAVAVKIETTKGTDAIAGSPVTGDFVASDCQVSFDQTTVPDPQYTGTLDSAPPIVGGLRPRFALRMALRGSGTPGTAPELGRLLQCCTMVETVTASALGAPTALAAGSTTTGTLGAPFSATAQAHQGMPILMAATTGDQPTVSAITNYATGKVATFAHTVSTTWTTTQTAQIPINVRYAPTSDETVYKTCTVYFYMDGLLWTFLGCTGSWAIEFTTGGIAYLTFSMTGQFGNKSTVSFPSAAVGIVRPTPPRFVGGIMRLNGALTQVRTFSLSAGVGTVLPDNPEASEGYDPAIPIERAFSGGLDPLMNTTNSVGLFTNFRTGVAMRIAAIIGTTAGNRFAVVVPQARAVANDPTSRDGLGVNAIRFAADGPDAGAFITQF